jgi:hypothetical protein
MGEPVHIWATYNDIHNIIRATADRVASEFKPDMFIAIGIVKDFSLSFIPILILSMNRRGVSFTPSTQPYFISYNSHQTVVLSQLVYW